LGVWYISPSVGELEWRMTELSSTAEAREPHRQSYKVVLRMSGGPRTTIAAFRAGMIAAEPAAAVDAA
jgi:hypothetical protein